MAPVAGSAYTYAYVTLGEMLAWIIGWDLILEYTVASATVAHGWSKYFQNFIGIFHLQMPHVISNAPFDFDPIKGAFMATGTWFDLPALAIVAILTIVLVVGIRESARFNNAMVAIKVAIVLLVIGAGVFYINPANWKPFAPFGWAGLSLFGKPIWGQTGADGAPVGMLAGAAIIFFAYIGFDSVSTHAEEARNPQRDVPFGIIASLLICTVLYIAVTLVLTGMVPYDQIDVDAPIAAAFQRVGLRWAQIHHLAGRGGRHHLGHAGADAQPAPRAAGDGAGRPAAGKLLRRHPPAFSHALEIHHPHGHHGRDDGLVHPAGHPGGAGQYRHAAGLRHRVHRGARDALHPPACGAAVPLPVGAGHSDPGRVALPGPDALAALWELAAALVWMVAGMFIYVLYGRHHSVMARQRLSEQAANAGCEPLAP